MRAAAEQATNIYVDGFNLYYSCLKGTPYKWLNIYNLCGNAFPNNSINRIRYFTAKIKPLPWDLNAPQRQATYIRALETLPNLSVHYGTFKKRNKRRPLANPIKGLPPIVEIIDTEEKGSDVNLASYLIMDGYKEDYDVAIVITNDSDLVEPIRIVKEEIGIPIGLFNPQCNKKDVSGELMKVAAFKRFIRPGVLEISQFPATLTDARGTFHKPGGW